MRAQIGIIFLLSLLLVLTIFCGSKFSKAADTYVDVKYNLNRVYNAGNTVLSMDYDRKSNMLYYITGSNIVTVSSSGVVTSFGGFGENVSPQRIGVYNSTLAYIASLDNNYIYSWDGASTTFGIVLGDGSATSGADSINAASSTTNNPTYSRFSRYDGDYFFADDSCKIRRISGNMVYLYAGGTDCVSSGDGSPAISAKFSSVLGFSIAPGNEMVIIDAKKLRRVYSNGTINTFYESGAVDNPTAAIAGDNGEVYFATDTITNNNKSIKKISNGVVSVIAGGGTAALPGSLVFSNATSSYNLDCSDIIMGNNNSLYCASSNFRIYRLDPYCITGYQISPDNMVCHPVCYGQVATSQSVCSYRNGSCIAPDTCSCSSGYTGNNCEVPICYGYLANDTANVCNGKGSCSKKDTCVCQNNYSGLNCNITSCFGTSNTNADVCSKRGSCKEYNTCTCSQSYYFGQTCNKTYCDSIDSSDSSVCSSHGTCTDYNQCACTSKWYGSYCNVTECFSVFSNSSNVCSGVGTCSLPNNCTCNDGYNGTNCENFDCFGVAANSGKSACSHNGTCTGPGACTCLPTYYGKTCDVSTCYGILSNYSSTVCSGNGACNMLDTCQCNTGYYGGNCSFPICYGFNYDDPSVCSTHGLCKKANTCTCNQGYTGSTCELNICYGINSDQSTVCSSSGSCVAPNTCQCTSGYRGSNCQYVELIMDAKTAVLTSVISSTLASYAPSSATSCQDIFSTKDLSYLGNSETVRCVWNKNTFKIYLGFRHFVYDNMIMDIFGSGKNFTLQVAVTKAMQDSASSTATVISPQLAAVPKTQLIIRTSTSASFQAYRNTSLVWSCSGCSTGISTLLTGMNDKPVVLIPATYLNAGTKFSLTVTSKNWIGITNTSSKVDISYDATSPYFELTSETSASQVTCSGFDCIIEVNSFVGSATKCYFDSPFDGLNTASGNYVIRFLNRYGSTILTSYYENSMKIQTTSNANALTYSMAYTSFDEVPIVLLNTEKQTYTGNSLTVTAIFIDPMIEYLSNSIFYTWSCSRSSTLTGIYTAYDCLSSSKYVIIPPSRLLEGYHSITVTVTLNNAKIVTTDKTATVQVVTSNIPDIVFDSVPPVYPPSRSLVLNAVISSSTQTSNVVWQVTRGNLLNTAVLSQSTTQSLDGYNIKSTLVIDKSYLLQGDSYTFSVSSTNDAGTGTASVSTVVDVSPRITCQAYDPVNSAIIAYSSDVVIDCISLSDYSIGSYHVDVFFNSTRVMTVSKTMKKSFVTKLPYGPNGDVRVEIRAVNKVGSVSSTSLNLKTTLPNSDNTLSGRIAFISSEYDSIKSTLTRLDSVATMHSMVLLIVQQNSVSEFASISDSSKATLTTLLSNMLTNLGSLSGVSSGADDKLAPVFIPFANDVYKLLAVVSSSTVSSNTALLTWVQFFVSSFNNVKTYYRSTLVPTIYDSKHITEIESLIDIGSKYISANQFTPYYKDTAIISRLINDVSNSTTTSSTIVDSSGTETRFDFVDRLQQINSKSITFTNYPSISISFPSDFYTQITNLGYSSSGTGLTLASSVSTSTKSSQVVSPVVDISLSTSSGSSVSVNGLSGNLIQLNIGSLTQPKANFTNFNFTCRFLNTTGSQWSQSGVSSSVSVISDDGQTVTFSLTCLTTHLTSFAIVSAAKPQPSETKQADNTGVIVGAVLGTLLPLILIAVIVVVAIIVVFVLYKRKKSLDTSRVQNIELVNKNVSSVYISDFPSEESTHFKQLVSVSSGSTSTDPLSRYTDMVKIGQGAFGSVFKAIDTKQEGKLKAIKVIRFNSVGELNNMLKEGTMLMNIDHPHVLKVNEFIIDKDNILCIDTDFCEEGDLTKLTLSAEPIAEPIIKQVIYQMCSALSFIHTKLKIIHRDVKPHNIFLRELTDFSVQTVLADFGLAKQDQTNSMSYAGTPLYMSPELGLGGKYNYNTDTWSLGVVAYQLITKDITTAISHLCLTGDSEDTKRRIKAKLDDAPGQYSEALKEVVLSMLEKDSASRPFPQEIVERPFFQDYRPKKKKNNIFRSSSAGEEDMYH